MYNGRSFHHLTLAVTALLFFLSSITLLFSTELIALSLAVFVGTFFIYRLSVWVPVISNKIPLLSFYEKPNKSEFIIYIILILSCCYCLSMDVIILFGGWGFISALYFTNFKFGRIELKGLRSIPLIKTVLLAFMWTIIGNIFSLKNGVLTNTHLINFIIRFTIIFLICLGVDLRDIEKDNRAGTTTLATYLGFKTLKTLMLVANTILLIFLFNYSSANQIDLFISGMLFFILLRIKINQSRQTFTLLLDGTLFIYSFLNFIASYIRFC
jgi:1,4-dihydroxy-2-naphthoate octaprenyltransferase